MAGIMWARRDLVGQDAALGIDEHLKRKQADDVKAQLTAGTYTIFKGPITDNKGKVVIPAGVARGQTDTELEKMDYLVEGVIGATS